jgi:soluble lytic murein transglycosylase-like protein
VLEIAEDAASSSGAGVPANAAGSENPATAGDEPADEESALSLLARTYERFALYDELVGVLRRTVEGVTPEFRLRSAGRMARAGRIRESVLVLSPLERAGGTFTTEAARLRYPLAYAAVVDERVDAEQIDRATFYALLREESLFDPEIASRAGAVGLAQLIPSTAADIARRMRLDEPVLTDPADNVTIGARYFSMLTEQFGTMSRALAAYNGGQGNVRRWERDAGALDEVLFHQAIPFPETYNHVRKVVVSASFYGYLYAGRAPAETARRIFALD